jgi:hypothetical protein
MRALVLAALLSGCAGSPYYAEVGVGYKFLVDPLLSAEYAGGTNPTFHAEVGREFGTGYSCGVRHWSHVHPGLWNNEPETYLNEAFCKKRWGGR